MSTHIQTWEYIEAVKENGKLKEQIGTMAAELASAQLERRDWNHLIHLTKANISAERHNADTLWKASIAKIEELEKQAASVPELEAKIERLRSLLFRAASHCDDETLAGVELVANIRAEIGWKLRSHE